MFYFLLRAPRRQIHQKVGLWESDTCPLRLHCVSFILSFGKIGLYGLQLGFDILFGLITKQKFSPIKKQSPSSRSETMELQGLSCSLSSALINWWRVSGKLCKTNLGANLWVELCSCRFVCNSSPLKCYGMH